MFFLGQKTYKFYISCVCFCLALLFSTKNYAQIKTDSLESLLTTNIGNDKKTRIEIELIGRYLSSNPKKAQEYLQKLAQKESTIQNEDNIVLYSILKITNFKKKGQFDSAKKIAFKTLKKAKSLKDSLKYKSKIYYLLGAIADDESNIKQAIDYHFKALRIAEKSNDLDLTATVLSGLGRAFMYLSEYDKAEKYFLKAIALKNKTKNLDTHLATYYANLSSCFDVKKEYKRSLFYLQKEIEILKKNKRYVSLVSTYNNKAYTLLLMKRLDEAEETIKKAFFMADSIHVNKEELMFPYSTYAEILFAKHKTNKALDMVEESIVLSNKYNDYYLEKYNLELLYDIFLKQKKYKKALEYYKKLAQVKDSIYNIKKRKQIEKLALSYETEKKNNEISLLEKDKGLKEEALKKSGWLQFSFFMLALFLFTVLILIKIKHKNKVTTDKLKQESIKHFFEKKISDSELQTLRTQMNPHFLFNSLNAINSFILKNDKEKASDYLSKFSKLIRNVLKNSKEPKITLFNELETLKLYIDLELVRFSNKFEYTIKVSENVEVDYIEIPPLIIQPYVENSILHGLLRKKGGIGKINVTVKQSGNILIITIEDNGIGREALKEKDNKNKTKTKSYGMNITKERLQHINKNKITAVKIIDLKDCNGKAIGTKVIVKIKI